MGGNNWLGRTKKTFRDGSYYRHVLVGKRTVKEGECAAIWTPSGDRKLIEGPKRVRLWFSHVRFLDRHVADGTQYLDVQFRDGRKEHVRGPAAHFFDPCVHQVMRVADAIKLETNEALVVYDERQAPAHVRVASSKEDVLAEKSQEGATRVERRIVEGPAVWIPSATEWIHSFSWHGSPGSGTKQGAGSKTGTPAPGEIKVPHALQFQKVRCMPDQMYASVKDVRTSDDAQLTVQLMIFYELVHIERMLDTTNDPIGDFINAASADVMGFGAAETYESFLQHTARLNDAAAFPLLASRMEACGFRLVKVVYRGYTTCQTLQEMHNTAVAERTRLRLQAHTAKEQQAAKALELHARQERSRHEQALAAAEADHELALSARKNEARRAEKDAAHEQELRHSRERAAADAEMRAKANDEELRKGGGLQSLGVDLTKYLCALEGARPHKHVRIETASGAPPAVHLEMGEQ